MEIRPVRRVVGTGNDLKLPGLAIRGLPLTPGLQLSGVQIVTAEEPLDISVAPAEHAINVLLSGQTRTVWHGHDFKFDRRLRPGHVTLVPASSEAYRIRYDGRTKTLRIAFAPSDLLTVSAEVTARNVDLRPTLGEVDRVVWQYATALAEELERPGFASALLADSLVSAMLITLIRKYTGTAPSVDATKPGLSAKQLQLVLDYIDENLHSALDLPSLAAVACLSKSHFLRAFKHRTGMTPHRYVVGERVARAQHLLADLRLPIAEIAYALGFSSQSHFTSAFRQSTGTTPKAFRAAVR